MTSKSATERRSAVEQFCEITGRDETFSDNVLKDVNYEIEVILRVREVT